MCTIYIDGCVYRVKMYTGMNTVKKTVHIGECTGTADCFVHEQVYRWFCVISKTVHWRM